MAYNDTFLKQLLTLVPTYGFDSQAQMYHVGQKSLTQTGGVQVLFIGERGGADSTRYR